MSDSLVPLTGLGNALPAKVSKRLGRELTSIQVAGTVLATRERTKVEAIADITQAAMIETSSLSAMEEVLVARTPHAEARLRHIADVGVAGMADIVLRAGRSLR